MSLFSFNVDPDEIVGGALRSRPDPYHGVEFEPGQLLLTMLAVTVLAVCLIFMAG